MILRSFLAAVAQFTDPRFRRALWLGIALAVALLFALYALLLMVIGLFTGDTLTLPLVGEVQGLGTLLSLASLVVMLGLSVFLMVPVASAFTGLFLDDIADAVEQRHYPGLPAPRRTGLWEATVDSVKYFTLLVALNLVGLLLFLFAGPFGIVGLWLINGFLLSREYFTMVAQRRLPRDQAQAMRRDNLVTIWMAGTLMAAPLSIPLVNLFIPVLGAATFTHLYHQLMARAQR